MNQITGIIGFFMLASAAQATVYYVDSESGNDRAPGTAQQQAWKTLAAVNDACLKPGDQVLFKRGGLWRGKLRAQSGEKGKPILYGAYGNGPKPILENSAARDQESDWIEVSSGIWSTQPRRVEIRQPIANLTASAWNASFQGKAIGSLKRLTETAGGKTMSFNRVTCVKNDAQAHLIQIWGPAVTTVSSFSILRIRMRSSIPFTMRHAARIMMDHQPWTTVSAGLPVKSGQCDIGTDWKTVDFLLSGADPKGGAGSLHFNFGGTLPEGALLDFAAEELFDAVSDDSSCLLKDVGILIFNHGEAWGVKKWNLEDLKNPLDYWYDPAEFRVFVRSEANPAKRYRSIELAFTEHIINENNCHDVVYEGLAVRYGGAHGFGGGGTQRLTIRGCDIYWIGGGLQFWKTKDRPVRFGNGIEFWGDAEDNLVERCRLWHIYDAAVTPQGKICRQKNITFRDNVIWDAEYSLEFWNRAPGTSENIRFEHNTCVDAGGAYSHSQRPDVNGAHMMFYGHNAISTNLVIRDNIFCGTTERCSRMMCDFRYALDIGHNLYFCAPDKLIIAFCEHDKTKHAMYAAGAFARYQAELGMDKGSLFAEPQFIDAAHHDYRLKPGTPGTRLATDGGSVGARF